MKLNGNQYSAKLLFVFTSLKQRLEEKKTSMLCERKTCSQKENGYVYSQHNAVAASIVVAQVSTFRVLSWFVKACVTAVR